MADIAPFAALRYNPDRVSPDSAVTQPYDKITSGMQERYYSASPYNLVRIILGRSQPEDSAESNTYTRASAFFREWRKTGILIQDSSPSLYRYSQTFCVPASAIGLTGHDPVQLKRTGFIGAGRIHDYSEGVVHRHEQTLSKPKGDRLNLLRATRAHFGQIFMLYSDREAKVDRLLAGACAEAMPDTSVTDEYGVLHQLWHVSDPSLIAEIRQQMRDRKLLIADGHHRYETALNYRNERRTHDGHTNSNAPYERVMMTFVNMESPGLVILPTHRVVFGLEPFNFGTFLELAGKYFEVLPAPASDLSGSVALLRHEGEAAPSILAITSGSRVILRAKANAADPLLQQYSHLQRQLDVVQLHKVLLEEVLGLSEESIRNQENLNYIREAEEAVARVHDGAAQVAFLMNPCRMEQVRDIAFSGGVLPQKSTDFYPKLLSGLTIYALD